MGPERDVVVDGAWVSVGALGSLDLLAPAGALGSGVGSATEPPQANALSLTPIKKAAKTVGKADTSGAAATVLVSASGKFVAKLGTLTIPADVNPQSDREVVIENVVLTGVFKQPGRFCTVFAGEVPDLITFTSKDNVVLYDAVTEGAAQPVHGKSDFGPGCSIPAE